MEHKRRHERYQFLRTGRLYWASADGQGSCAGDCFEASAYGLSAEVPQFSQINTSRRVEIAMNDTGTSSTRYSQPL